MPVPAPPVLSGSPAYRAADLSWTAVSGTTFYTLYRDGAYLTDFGSGTLSYTDTGLSPSTAYSYTVTAGNGSGESAYSNAVVITPTAGEVTTGSTAWTPSALTPTSGALYDYQGAVRLPVFELTGSLTVSAHPTGTAAVAAGTTEYVTAYVGGRIDPADGAHGWGVRIQGSTYTGGVFFDAINNTGGTITPYATYSVVSGLYAPETPLSVRVRLEAPDCDHIHVYGRVWAGSEPADWQWGTLIDISSEGGTTDLASTVYGLFAGAEPAATAASGGTPLTFTWSALTVTDLAGDASTGCDYVLPGDVPPETVCEVLDLFNRTGSGDLGTPDSGGEYAYSGTGNGSFDVAALAYVRQTGSGDAVQLVLHSATVAADAEVRIEWEWGDSLDAAALIAMRVQPDYSGYVMSAKREDAEGGRIAVYAAADVRAFDPATDTLVVDALVPIAVDDDTRFQFVAQTLGSTVRAKYYPLDADPGGWQVSATDTTITGPGRIGFGHRYTGSAWPFLTYFDVLSTQCVSAAAPRVFCWIF